MNRIEDKLNNPRVVLVVGAVAMALNVALYFGVFVPRLVPLVEHARAIGTSLPEAFIGSSHPEENSSSEASNTSNSEEIGRAHV